MTEENKKSCYTCDWNDDLLCECFGILIDPETETDTVCKYHKDDMLVYKTGEKSHE